MVEHVVLVDKDNTVLGTAPKATVHTDTTPLHRAFSLFLFNENNELLLQQRALSKKTWPGIWSNSCCGHPQLGEENADAVSRRVREELGIRIPSEELECMLPDFWYRAELDGIVEHEICPVFVARFSAEPLINPDEVAATRWVSWDTFLDEIRTQPGRYSEWCEKEAVLLSESKEFTQWLSQTPR